MSLKTPPNSKLILDWVYGYRGHQCHDNLFVNKDGNLVYFAAGLGIVYDKVNKRQRYYYEHDDDIVSLAMNVDNDLVATGQIGKSPFICVWSSNSMETKSILKNQHTHGISSVAFSGNNSCLVSVGLDPSATMNVWDWKKGKVLASTRAHSERVFDARFIPTPPNSPIRLVTCGIKHIKFWTLNGNALAAKKGIFGKVGEIQTMLTACVSTSDPNVCYAGTGNGDIYIWNNNTLQSVVAAVHKGAVHSIQSCSQGYVSGGKDGCIACFDITFKRINLINLSTSPIGYKDLCIRSVTWYNSQIFAGTLGSDIIEVSLTDTTKPKLLVSAHGPGELWALAVHPKKPIFATGSDDCCLKIWQISDKDCLNRISLDFKIRSCGFSSDGNLISVGLLNGSFRVLRCKDLSEVFRAHDRKEVIHEMKFSPDSHWLAVGSNDNFVDIYDVNSGFKKTGVCKGNSSFITHLDWSSDSHFIRTNSGAAELLIFRAPTGEHVIQGDILSTIKWNQSTGVLGTEIQGIWEKYTDTNDVNAADVNYPSGLIATGDDFGLVKLFNYPCLVKGAHFRKYIGHCAHVTNVRWSSDGRYLLSIGGSDQSIFLWRLESASLVNGISSGYTGDQIDSVSEGSDSGLSDIQGCDSELEAECQTKYNRLIDKADVNRLQKVTKTDLDPGQRRKNAPSNGIELEWVHGYRGYDCRNNLYYLQSDGVSNMNNEMVYHVAAVGIVFARDSKKQRFYTGHTDDILCLCLHPVKDYVATGQVGKDPTIHIWDAKTMKVISILKGHHERGVCAVDFSNDGRKLASVGLDDNHCIVVWDWRKGEKLATTRAHKDKIFVIKWSPHDSDALIAVGIRYIRFWSQAGGGFTSQRGTFGNAGKLDTQLCAAFDSRVEMKGVCYTGAANGQVYIWNGNVLQRTVQAHEGGCYAIDAVNKGFVTGGKDGSINLYDENFTTIYKTYKLSTVANVELAFATPCPTVRSVILGKDKILAGTHTSEILEISSNGQIDVVVQGHGLGEIWGLCSHPRDNIGATVSDDGQLMIWQINEVNHQLIQRKKLKGPARCCDISWDGSAIAVGFKDGSFSVFSLKSMSEIASSHHRKEEISAIKFSPEPGKYLAVGSHDNFVDVYSTNTHKRLSVCKGASSYITHIDWNMEGKLLMLNSGAKEQLFFEAPRCKRQTVSKVELEKMAWSTWSGVLGDTCLGIWPPKCDVTDINGTSLTRDGTILATGDDFGRVKLFEYPVKTKFAKFKQYMGHSAHVTNVCWSFKDNYLMSVGGGDTSFMIWRHKRQAIPMSHRTVADIYRQNQIHQSDISDTDSEEENGYDSDVEKEKNMDYTSKTYSSEISQIQLDALKKQTNTEVKVDNLQKTVSRNSTNTPLVQSLWLRESLEPASSGQTRSQARASKPVLTTIQSLELSHVHGYRGFDCRNNLHYLPANEDAAKSLSEPIIIYHAAGVGIVHNLATGRQNFFVHHNDDILCLTVNRHPRYHGVVATGEVGNKPAIHIWRATDLTLLSTVKGPHTHGVCSVNFSSTGTLLLSVGIDPEHTIAVTKWQEGTVIATINRQSQRIFHAEFRPDSDTSFVDIGVKHVKFWTVAGSQLVAKRGSATMETGKCSKMTTMLSVAFGTDDITYTGAMSGDVWVWQKSVLIRIVDKVHSGPVFVLYTTLHDGLIVSGGKEKGKDTGSIKLWDQKMSRCKPFHLAENVNFRGSSSTTGSPMEDRSLEVIRSISRLKGKILVGTQDNDIIEIDERSGDVKYLLQSHGEGLVNGVAVHPLLPIYGSCSEDGTVKIWDLQTKMLIQSLTTGAATCLDFSPDGACLAVGLKSGAVVILCTKTYRLLAKKKDRANSVLQVRFSPTATATSTNSNNNNHVMAVATLDNTVDIYQLIPAAASGNDTTGNTVVKSPKGHGPPKSNTSNSSGLRMTLQRISYFKDLTSPVQSMDFSTDATSLRLGLNDLSVIYLTVANGQVIQSPESISKLSLCSWTSIVGKEVAGVWPNMTNDTKQTDLVINTAIVSNSGNTLVSGDDYGLVKLFSGQFPLADKFTAPSISYPGHSAHVTCVRFVNDDSHLISSGGDDCCLFVWKCK